MEMKILIKVHVLTFGIKKEYSKKSCQQRSLLQIFRSQTIGGDGAWSPTLIFFSHGPGGSMR